MSTSALHSSASCEHYTPRVVVEAAREVLGWVDLDPASSALANRTVQAREYFSTSSLERPWKALRVFLNPPGGDEGEGSLPRRFWFKLAGSWNEGLVDAAIFVVYSLEQLQQTQNVPGGSELPVPVDFPICFPSFRLRYDVPDGRGGLRQGTSPTHASAIVLLPPWNRREAALMTKRFVSCFRAFGRVVIPTTPATR